MKRTIRTILCAAAVVMVAGSCQKSIEPANPAEEGKETIDICVNGLMGEYTQQNEVKSSLVNTVRVAWASGDVVYVFDGSKYLGKLTATLDKKADDKDEDRYARLSGTISTPATTPCTLSLVHSSLMTEPTAGAAVSELSIDMSAQSTATVPFVAYATMDYTGTSISNVIVSFQFASSVIKVNCTGLKSSTAISSATLSNVNTICKLALSGDKAPVVTGGTNGTITRTGDSYFAASKVNAEGEAVFQIAVPSLTSTSEPRVLTVEQGLDKFKDKNFSKKAVSAATSVNTVCQLVGLPAGALPGVFTVSNDDGATTTPIYFSQGNLWYGPVTTGATSTFNFEANQYDTPGNGTWSTKHISQFYWSKDFEEAVKQDFNEDQPLSGTDVFFTNEIQTTAKDGFKVIVGDKNQAGWRTLSMKEWQYLFYYREMKNEKDRYTLNITYGGEKGLVLYPDDYDGSALTSDTQYSEADFPDDCVFLPNAGYRDGSLVGDVGNSGNYWSSSAYNEDQDLAYDVSIFSSLINELNIRRSLGCSVRLVSEAE